MLEITAIFNQLCESRFWGEVLVTFKNGVPILVSKTEQIKLNNNFEVVSRNNHRDLIETPRGDHDRLGKTRK